MLFECIQEELKSEVESGRISVVPDPAPFFGVLGRRFPIGMNRIAWEKVREMHRVDVLAQPREIASEELRTLFVSHSAAVRSWLDAAEVAPLSRVIWVGDMTDVALEMSRERLLGLLPILFSLPQHSYALPPDGSWCLNYVMEGALYFARAVCL